MDEEVDGELRALRMNPATAAPRPAPPAINLIRTLSGPSASSSARCSGVSAMLSRRLRSRTSRREHRLDCRRGVGAPLGGVVALLRQRRSDLAVGHAPVAQRLRQRDGLRPHFGI